MSAGSAPMSPAQRQRVGVVLFAAVVGISTSAVLVKGMTASPVAVAAWRTAGAAWLLAPAWVPAWRRLDGVVRLRLLGAGLALAVHFVLWFASLDLTTVLRSTLLVCTTPVWAGLLDAVIDRRLPTKPWVAGVLVALPGVGLMSGASGGEVSLLGDGLAVAGAVAAAVYLRLGQAVRSTVGAAAAMGAMCAVAAVALWVAAGVTQAQMLGFDARTWALLVAAVLGPQLVGHQGFTYAMRWVPASTLAVIVLLEPVGAAILAALVFGEIPTAWSLAGGLLVLGGVGIAVGMPRRPQRQGSVPV